VDVAEVWQLCKTRASHFPMLTAVGCALHTVQPLYTVLFRASVEVVGKECLIYLLDSLFSNSPELHCPILENATLLISLTSKLLSMIPTFPVATTGTTVFYSLLFT
jgi:hypothetical protein